MKNGKKQSEITYEKYEYLAKKYASKIFSYEQLSYEYEDLLQEFRLKIFTSIKAYGRRWLKYLRGQAARPVPIKYYLECACSNKANDFMRYIARENYKTSIDSINYDYGYEETSQIVPESNVFLVNGVDLLEGLEGKERLVFGMFLRGYNKNILNKVYNTKNKAKKDAMEVVEKQKAFLIEKYGDELRRQRTKYETYSVED